MSSAYEDAVQGFELYGYFGNRVVKSQASGGRLVAVKVKPKLSFVQSEAQMMDHAAQNPNIKAPRVLGCYDVEPDITVMVSDLVPGVSLAKVWHEMNEQQRASIKAQLKEQLAAFRSCTQPYIGRIGHQPTTNFYDRIGNNRMGAFGSEAEFDEWCLSRLKSSVSRMK